MEPKLGGCCVAVFGLEGLASVVDLSYSLVGWMMQQRHDFM